MSCHAGHDTEGVGVTDTYAGRVIIASDLTKRFGAHAAVRDVSFRCEPGTVTGFLGPNGAGKSTTLRMICGLARPTAGSATVAGLPYGALPNPGRVVGVLLDASAQHAGRTGREVLVLAALVLGVARSRVDEVLTLVGLSDSAARKRVGKYSLGMRQRLGLAHALLGEPDILILDEPANGLDPQGIFWMRSLLRNFADDGGTVLLSSHLLLEIDAVADQLVVIGDGEIVAQGAKEELLASSGVRVKGLDPDRLRQALATAGIESTTTSDGAELAHADAEAVGRAAAEAGLILLELRDADAGNLEEFFLGLTAS
jgi:ABC-2 type transport system ATP-binding protein